MKGTFVMKDLKELKRTNDSFISLTPLRKSELESEKDDL